MNNRDETIREKLLDRLTTLGVDARNLALEVEHGTVIARGSVPNEEQRQRAIDALIGAHELQIAVRPVAPSDSDDGRGRAADPARRGAEGAVEWPAAEAGRIQAVQVQQRLALVA